MGNLAHIEKACLHCAHHVERTGMTAIDTFTPLESLLLVQSLATYGTQADAFSTVSAALKGSEILRDNANFNEEKLSEDSLKSRYLRLLKDEAKEHLQAAADRNDTAVDGESVALKKRPLSPHFPTIDDAEKFAYLIPQLVVKLWEIYKSQVIGQIKDDERRYDELVADVKTTEQRWQDEVAQQSSNALSAQHVQPAADLQSASSHTVSESPTARPIVTQNKEGTVQEDVKVQRAGKEDVPVEIPSVASTEARPQHRPSSTDARISSILNSPMPETPVPSSTKRASDVALNTAPAQPPQLIVPTQRRVPPTLAPATTPRANPLPPVSANYHQSPYESIQARPNLAPSPLQPPPAAAAYPPVLPIPSGMQAPPAAWNTNLNAPERTQYTPSHSVTSRHLPSPDQKRRQSLPSVDPQRPQGEPWQTPQLYTGRPPQQQPVPFHQQGGYQSLTPRGGGVMLPPFQVSPQNANASNQRTLPPPSTVAIPPKVHPKPTGTPGQSQNNAQSRVPRTSIPPRTPVPSAPQTPVSMVSQLLRRRPGVTFSPGSATGWKINTSTPAIEEVGKPMWSPVSEKDDKIGSANPQAPSPAAASKRTARGSKQGKAKEEAEAIVQPVEESSSQRKGKGTRGPSTTPSISATISRGRTRSQSVASHIEESMMASIPKKRKIKNEPNTPAAQPEEVPSDSKPQSTGRGRRKQEKAPAAQASNKRKRPEVDPDAEDMDELTTPRPFEQSLAQVTSTEEQQPLPQQQDLTPTITAFRNFQKMTVPIMNNITSHKHASLFANPVKERDAEGYTDIIRRPQDLKSIRAAIVAGSRTVVALTASDGVATPGTPRGAGSSTPSASNSTGPGGSTITLPWSLDLVPPRAIVNGAQLEQEVMRMFANAVMFNAGDEGVVRDTREMFESVEASIAAWRAAERNAAEVRTSAGAGSGSIPGPKMEEEPDELGEADDAIAMPAAKRRRA